MLRFLLLSALLGSCFGVKDTNHYDKLLNQKDTFNIQKDSDSYLYYKMPKDGSIRFDHASAIDNIYHWRVEVFSPRATESRPVHASIQHDNQVNTLKLPDAFEDPANVSSLSTTRRVVNLCPEEMLTVNSTLTVVISTTSVDPVEVEVKVTVEEVWEEWNKAEMEREQVKFSSVDQLRVSSPVLKYFYTPFITNRANPPRQMRVEIDAVDENGLEWFKTSERMDCLCSIVSIQQPKCPVYDTVSEAMRFGTWQTMLNKSVFVLDAASYPNGFLVVSIASPSDRLCNIVSKDNSCNVVNKNVDLDSELIKNIKISVSYNSQESEYLEGILVILGAYILIFVVSLTLSLVQFRYNIEDFEDLKELVNEKVRVAASRSKLDIKNAATNKAVMTSAVALAAPEVEAVLNSKNENVVEEGHDNFLPLFKMNEEVEESKTVFDEVDGFESFHVLLPNYFVDPKDIGVDVVDGHEYRLKRNLTISELSKKVYDLKASKTVYKKSELYSSILILMSIFYSLPVIQMVFDSSAELDETGNQDLCYFNHLCQKPLGVLKDFNHLFSNLGYVVFGLLFICIVFIKQTNYNKLQKRNMRKFDETLHGIPQQYGLYYAMGLALVMEGIMSGCYHICPATVTFQFDTTYMYLIAILMMVKLYQDRHPDISCSAVKAFFGLGLALMLESVSYYYNGPVFWAIFCAIYIIIVIVVTTHAYNIGAVPYDHMIVVNVTKILFAELKKFLQVVQGKRKCSVIRPRLVILSILSIFNILLCLYFGMTGAPYASTYLLNLFMGNEMLYFIYYITMKLICGERPLAIAWIWLGCSWLAALPALYLFTQYEKSSDVSPAESRSLNQECIFLHFYDGHDVWHFMGGAGVFFTFMFLFTIDEDCKYKRRDRLYVF